MKTNFRQRFNRTRSPRVGIGAGILVCVALAMYFFSHAVGSVASVVVSPLYSARTWFLASEAVVPRYFRDRSSFSTEIEALRAELARVSYDRAHLAVLEAENAMLRNISTDAEQTRIIADVIRRPNETPYDTLVVHKGSNDGVVEGALVYTKETVVGTVIRVFKESALIMLFSTPEMKSPIYIYGPDIFAHAYGMGGGVVRISVPQGIAVREGDPVTIPMADSGIYGLVSHVESVESNPEQYAYVTQEPALQNIRFVAIDAFAMPSFSYEDALSSVEAARMHATTSPVAAFSALLPVASTTASTTLSTP